MLDIKFIRSNVAEAKRMLGRRGVQPETIDRLVELDTARRDAITKVGELQSQRNQISAEFGKRRKAGEDTSGIKAQVDELKKQIADLEADQEKYQDELQHTIEVLPNFPHDSVPDGLDDTNNRCVRTWGEIKQYDFPLKPHWDLGTELGIFDFERSTKLAGTRFWMLLGMGAGLLAGVGICLLQRATGLIKMPGSFLGTAYPVIIQPGDIAVIAISIAVVGYLIALLPARKV